MGDEVTGTRRRGKLTAAELERIAADPNAADDERAHAITEMARAHRWLPPHLVEARRLAIARLHQAGQRPVDIARRLGLAPYAGRVSQILRAHDGGSHGSS